MGLKTLQTIRVKDCHFERFLHLYSPHFFHAVLKEPNHILSNSEHTHTLSYPRMRYHIKDLLISPKHFLSPNALSCILSNHNWFFVPLESFQQPFCSSSRSFLLSRCLYISSASIPVMSFYIIGRQVRGLKLVTAHTPCSISLTINTVLPFVIQSRTELSWRH